MRRESEPPEIGAWEALLRTHAAVVPALERLVVGTTGVPLSWYDVLLELERAPDRRLRMRDLGERVVLSRTRVSRVVDDMIEAGLVEKVADPEDGRATFAVPTGVGRAALRKAAPVYLDGIRRHFGAHLTSDEIAAITTGLRRVLDDRTPMRSPGLSARLQENGPR